MRRAVRKPVPVTVRRAVRITVRSTVRTAMRLIAALSTLRPFPARIRFFPPLLPSRIALLLLRLLPPRKIPQPRRCCRYCRLCARQTSRGGQAGCEGRCGCEGFRGEENPGPARRLPRTGTTAGGVEFEIERARGDVDEVIDPEQLNLF